MGYMYFNGYGCNKDYSEAFKWFQKAADNGVAAAYAWIALMYSEGIGVAQNYNEALKWFQKAADNGVVRAYSDLARMSYIGKGGIKDYSKAKTMQSWRLKMTLWMLSGIVYWRSCIFMVMA